MEIKNLDLLSTKLKLECSFLHVADNTRHFVVCFVLLIKIQF